MATDLLAMFDRRDIFYKRVNYTCTWLSVAILTPQTLPLERSDTKIYPTIVHFHGGALIAGTNTDPAFTSSWLLTLALTTRAVIMSPQYRLLPEASGTDLMDDISDFWAWLYSPRLPVYLSPSHILVAGESAGGYLAIQSALLFNPAAGIRAVAATYPAQYPDVAAYNRRHAGVAADSEDDKVVDAYLGAVRRGEKAVRVSTPWGTCAEVEGLIRAMGPTGRHREMMGFDGRLTLGGGLEVAKVRGGERAAVWVVQGREDDLVVKEGADEVVERIREALPEMPVKYTVEEGGHVFDLSVGVDEPWVKEGLDFVRKHWLGLDWIDADVGRERKIYF